MSSSLHVVVQPVYVCPFELLKSVLRSTCISPFHVKRDRCNGRYDERLHLNQLMTRKEEKLSKSLSGKWKVKEGSS